MFPSRVWAGPCSAVSAAPRLLLPPVAAISNRRLMRLMLRWIRDPIDQCRQQVDRRRVVQNACGSLHSGVNHELRQGQLIQGCGHRHCCQRRGADQVTGDHLPPLAMPVAERVGVQSGQCGRQLPPERQPGHLAGGGVAEGLQQRALSTAAAARPRGTGRPSVRSVLRRQHGGQDLFNHLGTGGHVAHQVLGP